ncbi:MAG TPA: hypothetical protein DHW47_06290 [Oscillibacter sp.]|nr:hypothetical protein [Oscillibacter sp.]
MPAEGGSAMRATRLSLMVLLVVLAFVLWNAAWVTDRCGEWTAALDEAEAALAQGGSGQQQLDALNALWQEPQGYLHIVISHEELDEAEALLAQAEAMAAQGDSQSLYPVLAELRGQFRLIAETQRISAKNIF